MARLISDASKMTDVQKELGIQVDENDMSFGNIVNAISVMQKQMDISGTTAKEAMTTITGSVNSAKASFSDFLSGSGDIDAVVETFITAGTNIGNALIELAPKITDGIVKLVNGIMPQLPPIIQKVLPVILQGVIDLAVGIVNALPDFIAVLVSILPELTQSLILGLVQIVNAIANQLPVLIPQIVQAILEIIPVLIDNLPLFVKAGWQLVIGLAEGLIQAIPQLLTYLPKIISSIINYFKQMPSMFVEVGGNLIKGLWNGISNAGSWVIEKIKGLGSSILKSVTKIFKIGSPSKEFAWIGEMNMLGLEEGMEDMQPELEDTFEGMFDLSPNLYGTSSISSPSINVTVNNSMETDPLGQVVSNIKTFSGGAKNDYNYGQGA